MIKKTLQYVDIDGITREEDFYFNLTKAEALELQVSRHGGFSESIQAIIKSKDPKAILATIKEVILSAYGERAPESRHFIKKRETAEAFSHTEAFSNLFMELFTDKNKAAEFFNGLLPKDMQDEAKLQAQGAPRQPQDHQQKQPNLIVVDPPAAEVKTITRAEAVELSTEELNQRIQNGWQIV